MHDHESQRFADRFMPLEHALTPSPATIRKAIAKTTYSALTWPLMFGAVVDAAEEGDDPGLEGARRALPAPTPEQAHVGPHGFAAFRAESIVSMASFASCERVVRSKTHKWSR